MGAGGGGKLILNCSNWDTDPSCIQISSDVNITLTHGDFSYSTLNPLYYLTMHMFSQKSYIFKGGIQNINSCKKGHFGPFCQLCPEGAYKPTTDLDPCIPCPCSPSSSPLGSTSVTDCQCFNSEKKEISIVKVGAIFFIFAVLLLGFYILMKSKKKYQDKNYLGDLRYKVNDIPNSFGRIYASGSNTPHQPWKIDRLSPDLAKFFHVKNFNQFTDVS